jgi:hypothetical protein
VLADEERLAVREVAHERLEAVLELGPQLVAEAGVELQALGPDGTEQVEHLLLSRVQLVRRLHRLTLERECHTPWAR